MWFSYESLRVNSFGLFCFVPGAERETALTGTYSHIENGR